MSVINPINLTSLIASSNQYSNSNINIAVKKVTNGVVLTINTNAPSNPVGSVTSIPQSSNTEYVFSGTASEIENEISTALPELAQFFIV